MKNLLFFLIGMALLAGLFVYMKPEAPPAAPEPVVAVAAPAARPAPAPVPVAPAPQPQLFELTVNKGVLFAGPDRLQVKQGDEVILRVTSDQDDELHLHGYDLSLALKAGATGELRFVADRSGRFEYELHAAHASIGAMEVLPQ